MTNISIENVKQYRLKYKTWTYLQDSYTQGWSQEFWFGGG